MFYEVVPDHTTFISVVNATSGRAAGAVAGTLCKLTTTASVPVGGILVVTYTFSVNNTGDVAIAKVTVVAVKLPTLNCVLPTTSVAPGVTNLLNATNNVYAMTSADVATGRVVNSATAIAVP